MKLLSTLILSVLTFSAYAQVTTEYIERRLGKDAPYKSAITYPVAFSNSLIPNQNILVKNDGHLNFWAKTINEKMEFSSKEVMLEVIKIEYCKGTFQDNVYTTHTTHTTENKEKDDFGVTFKSVSTRGASMKNYTVVKKLTKPLEVGLIWVNFTNESGEKEYSSIVCK